jgi:hypothetical protein
VDGEILEVNTTCVRRRRRTHGLGGEEGIAETKRHEEEEREANSCQLLQYSKLHRPINYLSATFALTSQTNVAPAMYQINSTPRGSYRPRGAFHFTTGDEPDANGVLAAELSS